MSKKKKRYCKCKSKPVSNAHGSDRHHCLFQGRHWDGGYAQALRQQFVYLIPVAVHRQLHNELLHDVPRPPDDMCKTAWLEFQKNREYVESLDMLSAIQWLRVNIPYEPFQVAMQMQYLFFKGKL